VKFNFAKVKMVIVIVYTPCDDKSMVEKFYFWNECNMVK